MRLLLPLLLLLLVQVQSSEFLVGTGEVGQELPVLCEGQQRVFVAMPDGASAEVRLDSSGQGIFVPTQAGPHTVLCGRETKTTQVSSAQSEPKLQAASPAENFLTTSVLLLFFGCFMLALFFLAKAALLERTEFVKIVVEGKATLRLRAGKRMDRIEMEDPVAFGQEPLAFSIPALAAGAVWEYEYELEEPHKALPAHLSCFVGKDRQSMLSEIYIMGKKSAAPSGGLAVKKKLKRAEG